MSQDGRDIGISGQTAGFITIAVGFAILIAGYMTKDWLLVIPVAMIEVGIYGIALGAFGEAHGTGKASKWGTNPSYTMFWGSLIALIGALWLVNNAYPNNLPALMSAFLIWFGIAVMMLSRNKDARPKIW